MATYDGKDIVNGDNEILLPAAAIVHLSIKARHRIAEILNGNPTADWATISAVMRFEGYSNI